MKKSNNEKQLKNEFLELQFTDISQYFDVSKSYFIDDIFKLYFLNKSFNSFDFIISNKIEHCNTFLIQLNTISTLDENYNFEKIFDILIKSPSTFDILISLFKNDPKIESFITDVYFPSQFAFFFCDFFQEKAKLFISEYINKSTNSKYVIRIAASFIISSNKFKESFANTFIKNKSRIYVKSLNSDDEKQNDDHKKNDDFHILIRSFFEVLHLLTNQQYLIFKEIIKRSKPNATEMILKYILPSIIRNWEYSDFFTVTNILFTSYEKEKSNTEDNETSRFQLLKELEQFNYSTNEEFFDDLFEKYFDIDIISHQETIVLDRIINSNQIKTGFTQLELIINQILTKIYQSNNNTEIADLEPLKNKFFFLLRDSSNLFNLRLNRDTKFSDSDIPSQQYECDQELKEDYLFFQKVKAQALETLQDFDSFYNLSLKNSIGFRGQGQEIYKSLINPQATIDSSRNNAKKAYKGEIKFYQNQRKLIGERMDKARLLKEEIKSAENIIDDLILRFIFQYNDQFNIDELMATSKKATSDEQVIISLTNDTTKFILKCFGQRNSIDENDIKDFLINCKNPDEIFSFLFDKNEKYQSRFTQRNTKLQIINQISMCIKFERAKAIYIFSNIKFDLIEGVKLNTEKENVISQIQNLEQMLDQFQPFSDIGVLLGSTIIVPELQKRGLYLIHFIRIMNIIMQILYCFKSNQKNKHSYFEIPPDFNENQNIDQLPFYLFYLFVNPGYKNENKNNHENLLNIFQMFNGSCVLASMLTQQFQDEFKFIDKNIINIMKNFNKKISDQSNQNIKEDDQLSDAVNDLQYMIQYCDKLMYINNKLIENFIK